MAGMLWKKSAAPAKWAPPSAFSIGYPTAGDRATQTHPTRPGATWFQGAYEEIRNVIETAGLVFDPSDTGQLLAAIQELLHPTFELREDGGFELREDDFFELRQ